MNDQRHRSGLTPDEYKKLTGFEGDWRDGWWADDFLAMMVARWRIAEARTVLDVGCGVGHWGQRLMRFLPEASLVGVDAEASWMPEACERAEARGLRASYQVAQAQALPFDDGQFDVVTCQTLLMHVPDPVAVLREMVRVLRPGGVLVAAEPNNFANTAARCMALPGETWATTAARLELHHTLTAGKKAVGEGDQSIGEKLPLYLAQVGLSEVRTAANPQTAPCVPPYDEATGGRELRTRREVAAEGRLMEMGGTRANTLRFFLAGGGTEARFDELVAVALQAQADALDAFGSQAYASSGGHLHYLVSGRKSGA